MDAMQIANSVPMWCACALPVALIVAQAWIFMSKARTACRELGVSDERARAAAKSAAITSIGPSIVILSGMLSLLVTVGGPVGWMRLSLIGSVMFESIAAGIGTRQVGVELGTGTMTPTALAMAVWTMVLCSIGWVIFATVAASRMEKIQRKIAGGDVAKMVNVATAAIVAIFASFTAGNLVRWDPKAASFFFSKPALSAILGAASMAVMMRASKGNKKLAEWNLTVAMLAAMILTALLPFGR